MDELRAMKYGFVVNRVLRSKGSFVEAADWVLEMRRGAAFVLESGDLGFTAESLPAFSRVLPILRARIQRVSEIDPLLAGFETSLRSEQVTDGLRGFLQELSKSLQEGLI